MKVYDNQHIKNVVLLGSPKSGKTTLAETMLFEAGLLNRRGSVENHNTVSDFHEIEHQRENSIYATPLHTEWRGYKINIIDTPGLDDFIGEIVSSVRVADTCVLTINAQHGVEVGTEIIWNYIEQFQKPTIIAINHLDHNKADFDGALDSLKNSYGDAVALMQYPYNPGDGFNAIVDLLKMTMYKFPPDGGKPEKLPIPASEKEKATQLHNELVEKAAINDEKLMELYFEKGNLDEDELRQGLRVGMLKHDIFPVFCISAKQNMGSGRMMGFIDNVAPGAADILSEKTEDGQDYECKADGKLSLFIFKTMIEPYLGKVSFFKVCSGEISTGMDIVNAQTGATERINQLYIMDGNERHPVQKLVAGDIGATVKLKDSSTNHTLNEIGHDVKLAPMVFPEPRIRVAIVAESKNDEEKLSEVIKDLHEEDPTLSIEFSNELKQLILSAQGELHLSITQWRLEHVYNLKVHYEDPKVSYRETIQKQATSAYRHKKQSGGAGQFAEVTMTILPYTEGMDDPQGFNIRDKQVIDLSWGGKLVFYSCIVGGVIDARFMPSILKGVMEKMEDGPITGSYARDICVLVHDGKMHAVDSNDISFKIAGLQAFKKAFLEAEPKIMEPVNELEVMVPEELLGEVMTDLQTRRAIIQGIDSRNQYQIIKAKVPLKEITHYCSALKSITQGRASFSTSFFEFAPVPYELQKQLIANQMLVEA
ncbi:elongation factor G [Catalinimonas alkaloidigena]|uniref:elongation factor G n=1 Tax=Catalinimonas alkaloidigena TaxID=1075417 RepID=UPI002405C8F4|nr:elongation factor G [Catalinimonas alkaloidigena]MDF9797433.1 elongation factor G [Catalinimonas alkaloidigena]